MSSIEGLNTGRRATIVVAIFGQNVFWVTGLLNPKSFEFKSCVAIFFGVYLSHGILHQGGDYIFLQNHFLGGIEVLK